MGQGRGTEVLRAASTLAILIIELHPFMPKWKKWACTSSTPLQAQIYRSTSAIASSYWGRVLLALSKALRISSSDTCRQQLVNISASNAESFGCLITNAETFADKVPGAGDLGCTGVLFGGGAARLGADLGVLGS